MSLRPFPAGLIRTPFATDQGWLSPRWQQFLQTDAPLAQGGLLQGPVVDATGRWSTNGVAYVQQLLGYALPQGMLSTPVVTENGYLSRPWQQYFGSQL